MFDNLTDKLTNSFKILSGNSKLSENNIKSALNEVRRSLIEADVALSVVQDFLKIVEQKSIGIVVGEGLNPKQEFIKLVQDELTTIIGSEVVKLNLATQAPAVIMVAGLQGAGKTTTVAKLANYLQKQKKKVMVVSADVYRPAAIKQLELLSTQIACGFYPSSIKDSPAKIVANAKKHAQKNFFDVLIVDTAGRLHIDNEMMAEIKILHKKVNPIETLFVVDSMSGQDGAIVAKEFADNLPLTGVVLTKTDGDARGGVALSVKHITGKPIKFLGIGEKIDNLEVFHPDRVVSRILGMGDIMSLIEEIEQKVDKKKAAKMASKMQKGKFDMFDMRDQLQQMEKMGGMQAIMGKIPGMSKIPDNVKNKAMKEAAPKKSIAIINSMTDKERIYVNLIKGTRKQRIANGSGVNVQDVTKLLKQFEKMKKMMKKMQGGKMQKMMKQMQGADETTDFNNMPQMPTAGKLPFN